MILPRDFDDRATLIVSCATCSAKCSCTIRRGAVTSGRIVEVEAYIGEDDAACHAAPGRTVRNAPLYGPPGFAYVYLNYGIHNLVNAVTEPRDSPAAVLIRALEPVEGIELMRQRRRRPAKGRRSTLVDIPDVSLCRGPGNLTMAMGITLGENEADLCGSRLFIEDLGAAAGDVVVGPRIGIRVGTEHPWRFWLEGHPAVSKAPGGGR
ncbi:MAG: DNA-3-methyladenine glycosylase [Vicinamibacterales bacterium]